MSQHNTEIQITLWDLPLRIFHWGLVVAVLSAIATGIAGGDWMTIHGRAGQAVLGLLVFRLVWGFIGNHHARFAAFFPTPSTIRSYVQGQWHGEGHNPLGALSVFALLGLLALQVGTGLVGNDDIAFTGPLASLVTDEWSQRLTGFHHLLAKALYVLLGLHVLAIAFYTTVKKHNLIKPMLTGRKSVSSVSNSPVTQVSTPNKNSQWNWILALSLAILLVWVSEGRWIAW